MSRDPKEIHFGLGPDLFVDLTIHWPGGQDQEIKNLLSDAVYEITLDGVVKK